MIFDVFFRGAPSSFHRHGFREISGLVDFTAADTRDAAENLTPLLRLIIDAMPNMPHSIIPVFIKMDKKMGRDGK